MEINFYHLTHSDISKALPALLHKVIEAGKKATILSNNKTLLAVIDDSIWQSRKYPFLPHDTADCANPERQPILLMLDSDDYVNPANDAEILLLTGLMPDDILQQQQYSKILYLFDGNNAEETSNARAYWKEITADKNAANSPTYWKQAKNGNWKQGS